MTTACSPGPIEHRVPLNPRIPLIPFFKFFALLESRRNCPPALHHGLNANTFHRRCNFRGPTITVVALSNGRAVGAYTDRSWESSNGYGPTGRSFIFSFDEATYAKSTKEPQYGVYDHQSLLPVFGAGHDFKVHTNSWFYSSRLRSYEVRRRRCKLDPSSRKHLVSNFQTLSCFQFDPRSQTTSFASLHPPPRKSPETATHQHRE